MRWRLAALAVLALAGWMIWTAGPRTVPAPPAPSAPGAPVSRPPLPRPPTIPPLAPQITSPVERILIEKAARRMTVWQRDGNPRVFDIALGFAPGADKVQQGDGRTPEGEFRVDRRNDRSAFHLSLGLNYPRPQDRARARAAGVDPGGDIMIHGQPNQVAEGFKVRGDWTAGCIAVTNPEIAELFTHTPAGTPVEIRP